MRTITISGNLGKDPQMNEVSGTRVANFNLAVKSNQRNQDGQYGTDWFRCSVWGNRAKVVEQYFHQGSHVVVTGTFEVSEYNEKTQLNVNVDDFDLPDNATQREAAPQTAPQDTAGFNFDDSDSPF